MRTLVGRIARRRWFVVVGLLATLLPALALTLLTDDMYRAESSILLQRTSVEELLEFDEPINANAGGRASDNEIGVIEGVVVYNQVLTQLGLADAPHAQASAGDDSDVVVVGVEATTELAARLTNAYVNAYIDVRLRQNNESAALAVADSAS